MRKILLSLLVLAVPAAAAAQSAEDIAGARIGYYRLLGHEMSLLAAMAKGDVEYNAEKAAAAAKDLQTLTQYSVSDLFAPGTSNAELPGKTRALPVIWEDMAGLGDKGAAYVSAVEELNGVAGNGLDALRPAVGKLGGTCKSCHDDFRAKDF
ncbi:c-type cytochrome [Afifella pfennigii]|uniref:c-type cytochrome n=1 Tax=Afifella pfennigii TaxID=209897 RepID=UPI0004786880|nr:cytochrome c [Afifella pfennigii]